MEPDSNSPLHLWFLTMRYLATFTFVLCLFYVFVGCDNTTVAEPNAEGAATITPDVVNTQLDGEKSETADSKIDSQPKPELAKAEPVKPTLKPVPEKEQHDGRPTAQIPTTQGTVNHQDPTSYPITELAPKAPGEIKMLSWNVESGGAEGETICEQLTAMNDGDRYDVVALTEVLPENLKKFRMALGRHYKYAYSKSGRNDRMQLLYNENRFKEIRQIDLDELNYGSRYRAPMAVQLKEKKTDARPEEVEFLVMVNHLVRGKADLRQKQADELVEWARNETLPIFALGDYNFDYVFKTNKGNPAFNKFMRDNVWRWVTPTELVDTNWYDDPESRDGLDDYPGSMLDFAFVAGPAKDWKTTCQVIVRKGDFPDDKKTSDHRPFELTTNSPAK